MEIRGRSALVTGAASGIGLALTDALLRAGARVIMVDGNPDELMRTCRERAHHGQDILPIVHDVRDRDGWNSVCDQILGASGHVHIICNNAGVASRRGPVGGYDPDLWDRVISINLTGVFNGCHAFLTRLREPRAPAHIVNTASVCGLFATQGMAAYSASKHAVIALSDAIRFEQREADVGVTVLCPGFVSTAIAANSVTKSAKLTDAERGAMIERLSGALSADKVAEATLEAITSGRAYVFTHPEYAPVFSARCAALEKQFQASCPADPEDDIRVLGADWLDQ